VKPQSPIRRAPNGSARDRPQIPDGEVI
jgi:hypothetical protein